MVNYHPGRIKGKQAAGRFNKPFYQESNCSSHGLAPQRCTKKPGSSGKKCRDGPLCRMASTVRYIETARIDKIRQLSRHLTAKATHVQLSSLC
ncbi:Serine/threonine-protein kinase SKY1 [Fusarium oxysporum f. sp. albedinis]|nr:Serine/threonine-protein kinase SKY1 [Fusarium oxysporum f. sp. albedinis]